MPDLRVVRDPESIDGGGPSIRLAVLGATGSIGRSTMDVVRALPGRFRVVALSAHQRLQELEALAHEFRPRYVVATCRTTAEAHRWHLPDETELLHGPDGVQQVVTSPEVATVVASMVGRAGLEGTWGAVDAGKQVALANKESLVMAGAAIMQRAQQSGAVVLPIDSEHSAIFQALQSAGTEQVRQLVLTASGGPFLRHSAEELEQVTATDALRHPIWSMGPKITVDSATMMNKALEIIEARWLFGISPDRIRVVVHPQSIVHGGVPRWVGYGTAESTRHAVADTVRSDVPASGAGPGAADGLEFPPIVTIRTTGPGPLPGSQARL